MGLSLPREQKSPGASRPRHAGMPIPKIKDISVIECAPAGVRLTVVKITTDQDGLYGYGCATFTQRADLVRPAVEKYLKPLLLNKDHGPHRRYLAGLLRQFLLEERAGAEQCHQRHRSSPVGHQGTAGRPCRFTSLRAGSAGKPRTATRHADGADYPNVVESAKRFMAQGFRNVRVQIGIPGMAGYGAGGSAAPRVAAAP